MNNHDLLWIFVDFHNLLITTVNDASGCWDLSKLMNALKDHKLRGLSLNCARTINDNREFLAKDKSKLMEAIKHETDAYALVSGQTTEFVEPEQLQYLFKSLEEMQLTLLQFNANHIDR